MSPKEVEELWRKARIYGHSGYDQCNGINAVWFEIIGSTTRLNILSLLYALKRMCVCVIAGKSLIIELRHAVTILSSHKSFFKPIIIDYQEAKNFPLLRSASTTLRSEYNVMEFHGCAAVNFFLQKDD